MKDRIANIIDLKFWDFDLDIDLIRYTEDEIEWQVFGADTPHLNLLDTLLHENYNDEINDLIIKDVEEKSKEYEMEQRLSDHEVRLVL